MQGIRWFWKIEEADSAMDVRERPCRPPCNRHNYKIGFPIPTAGKVSGFRGWDVPVSSSTSMIIHLATSWDRKSEDFPEDQACQSCNFCCLSLHKSTQPKSGLKASLFLASESEALATRVSGKYKCLAFQEEEPGVWKKM